MNNEFEMNCEIVRDLLPAYLEHDVSEQTEILIREHLQGCNACSNICRQMADDSTDILLIKRKKHKNKRFKKKVTLKMIVFSYVLLLLATICFCIIDILLF